MSILTLISPASIAAAEVITIERSQGVICLASTRLVGRCAAVGSGVILVRAAGPDGAPRQVGIPDVPVDDWTEFQNAPDDSPRSIFASLRCRSRFLHLVETAIVSVEENSTFIASNTPLLRSRLPKFAGRTNCWVFLFSSAQIWFSALASVSCHESSIPVDFHRLILGWIMGSVFLLSTLSVLAEITSFYKL